MSRPSPTSMQPDMSWVGVLEHHARRTPDKPIAVFGDDVVTYRGMADRAAALAAGLQARGVGAGDVVGLLSYNSIEFLATIFAANHLGAIAMPINWRLAAEEVRFILDHSQARALVCDDDARRARERGDGPTRRRRHRPRVRHRRAPSTGGSGSPISRPASAPVDRAHVEGDDIHRLMYTSGTTGRPKGVMITHANLAWKNYAHIAELGLHQRRRRSGLRPALPRRRARPRHHLDDRGGRDDHHPPGVRRRRPSSTRSSGPG